MKAVESKPWIDQHGKIFNDRDLIEVSKSWSADAWEAFLQETVERTQSRHEVVTSTYSELCNETAAQYELLPTSSVPVDLCREIDRAIKLLPRRNRAVVRGIYWSDLSEREIAVNLKIAQSFVRDLKKRSLKKIKGMIPKCTLSSGYLLEGPTLLTLENRTAPESGPQGASIHELAGDH